jgi:hypothetical protein
MSDWIAQFLVPGVGFDVTECRPRKDLPGALWRNASGTSQMAVGTTVAANCAMVTSNVSSSGSGIRIDTDATARRMDLYPQMARA